MARTQPNPTTPLNFKRSHAKASKKQHTCNNIDRHLTEASKIAAKAMLGCLQASGGLWGVELAAWRWQKYVIIAFEGFHEICQIHTTP